jgi:hypothetical protein
MFLLDTNVVSELRRPDKAAPKVAQWAASIPVASTFLSAISVLELELGVLLIERKDASRGSVLRLWLERQVLPHFEGRILSVDVVVARRCAHLHAPNPRAERDALIAATALVHAMTVVARNIGDFAPLGASVLNPWD